MARDRTRVQLSERGQITLPADVRKTLGLEGGNTFRIDVPDVANARAPDVDLPPKDVPVYAAAVAVAAHVLITGDRKHFRRLMDRGDLPIRVRTLRAFLVEGPGQSDG